jgi:hypothetical protein
MVFVRSHCSLKSTKASIFTGFQVKNYATTPFVETSLAREL